ncbi:hypothetical protein Tco_0071496 [Tanacetum coccineum]
MFSPTRKKSRWGTVFPTGLKRYKEPLVEPKEIGYLIVCRMCVIGLDPQSWVILAEAKSNPSEAQQYSLIPLSRGSFDVIVGMDWLSKRKFVIVCYEKVVRIPLEGDEIFRVHRERTLGAAKALKNAKVDEPWISVITVVQDFTDMFPEDLSMITTTTIKETPRDLNAYYSGCADEDYKSFPMISRLFSDLLCSSESLGRLGGLGIHLHD